MRHTHRRLTRQAKGLGVVETVLCWNVSHLEVQFQQNFAEVLDPSIRGFGIFVWKPQIILQALELIPVGLFSSISTLVLTSFRQGGEDF